MSHSEVLVRNNRDPLFGVTADRLRDAFRQKLQGRVRQAYFFGGFAAGRLHPRSDVDLILVQDTDKPFLQRGEDFLDLYDIVPAIDLLIYTPEEFARLTK